MNARIGSEGKRVLIVDDEPANVQLLERLFGRAGYDTHGTTDPTQVAAKVAALTPDLILLDLHMPVLDGFGVMTELAEATDPDDFLPILVLTADIAVETRHKALQNGASDYVTKPFDPVEVMARARNLLTTRALHKQLRRYSELLEEKVAERTNALWATVGELERSQKDLRLAQEETIHSLSQAAEFRDDETSRHIERMSRYCGVLAEAVGLDRERCDTIRLAAKMHDVGKIGVPDAILLKPGKLTPEEYEIMKAHAQIGYDILSGSTSELARTAATVAWTHHEKIDGRGYPRGLPGEDIPVEGRIAAVADVFDALTTDRVYRKAFTLPEALEIMREGRGTHFDAEILDQFLDRIDEVLSLKAGLDEAPVAMPGRRPSPPRGS